MKNKKYGTVPLVVCIRVPVSIIFRGEQTEFSKANLLKSKLKSLRITKEELIKQFNGQDMMEMTDHFDEEELEVYLQGI